MRRIVLFVMFVVLVASTGCMSPETKRQWNDALGDLNGNNTKSIAPISAYTIVSAIGRNSSPSMLVNDRSGR